MKIKLTEEQYNRLLVENDKDFLDGEVNFPHIGNKVTKFITKIFNFLKKKNVDYIFNAIKILKNDFSLSEEEADMLAYNYTNVYRDVEDYNDIIGEPLKFWGKFHMVMDIPMYATASGWLPGKVTGYGTSYEDFIENMESSDYEEAILANGYVEYDVSDMDWEIDEDYLQDRVGDVAMDLDGEDNVHLGW